MKYEGKKCVISAEFFYDLLKKEAELAALFAMGVENWEHYDKALKTYAAEETLKRQLGPLFSRIPPEVLNDYEAYVNWENEDIMESYIQEEKK